MAWAGDVRNGQDDIRNGQDDVRNEQDDIRNGQGDVMQSNDISPGTSESLDDLFKSVRPLLFFNYILHTLKQKKIVKIYF
jgi:hypothetical protein